MAGRWRQLKDRPAVPGTETGRARKTWGKLHGRMGVTVRRALQRGPSATVGRAVALSAVLNAALSSGRAGRSGAALTLVSLTLPFQLKGMRVMPLFNYYYYLLLWWL